MTARPSRATWDSCAPARPGNGHLRADVFPVVERLDEAYDRPCAGAQPNLLPYAQKLVLHGHLTLQPPTEALLKTISITPVCSAPAPQQPPRPKAPRLPNPHPSASPPGAFRGCRGTWHWR